MRKKKFREIEKIVKDYYKNEHELNFLKSKLERIQSEIKEIQKKIDNSDININADIKAVAYDGVGSGRGGSSKSQLDEAIERSYRVLENRLVFKIDEEINVSNRVYKLEDQVYLIRQYIETLRFDLREVIERIYKYKEPVKLISMQYYGGVLSTVHRKRNKALIEINKMIVWKS